MCYEETTDPIVPLADTYNLFYTEKEYQQVKQILQFQFQTMSRFSYSLEELLQFIYEQVTFPKHVTLRCLNELIQRQEPFRNPIGFTSYLKEKQNEFFLSYHVLTSKEEDVFYTQQGELYPIANPFTYLDQLELSSIESIMKTIQRYDQKGESVHYNTAKRVLSHLPKEVTLLILRGVIQLYYDDPTHHEERPYLKQLIEIGLEKNWLISSSTLQTTPPERYALVAGRYQWMPTGEWSVDNIGELVDILQSDPAITMYGFMLEGKLYLYDLAQKKFLTELKRHGRNCETIPIDNNRAGTSLQEFYQRLTGQPDLPTTDRTELCTYIKTGLEEFTLPETETTTKPFPLLFSLYVHETMREYIKKKQEEAVAKTKASKVPPRQNKDKSEPTEKRKTPKKP